MTGGDFTLVLASGSPRRADTLRALGLKHRVDPAHIPEDPLPGETALALVERLAREKAREVAARHPGAHVLGGDTVVILDGRILSKPTDPGDAVGMLTALAGREHQVATGLALAAPGGAVVSGVDTTRVVMRDFDAETARRYVATGEPMDKAGAYGIQGRGGALVRGVVGDYFTVMGFSVALFVDLLGRSGLRYEFGAVGPASPGGVGL